MTILNLATWLASRPRKPDAVVDTIVLHATAGGTLSGALSTLRLRGLSYHYLIEDAASGRDGVITKGVPAGRIAFHAGNSYGPHEDRRGVSRQRGAGSNFMAGCSVNGYTIGISFVNANDGIDPYGTLQVDSCVLLINALKVQFPALRWLTTHAIVSPGRKTDPRSFPVATVAARVGLQVWEFGR